MTKRPFGYIRLHNLVTSHPKIAPLSDAAFRLIIESWCWCSVQLSDGKMPRKMWETSGKPKTRRELVDAGLVEEFDSEVVFRDYLDWQQSREEVQAIRAKRVEAGRMGGKAKALASATASATASA